MSKPKIETIVVPECGLWVVEVYENGKYSYDKGVYSSKDTADQIAADIELHQ